MADSTADTSETLLAPTAPPASGFRSDCAGLVLFGRYRTIKELGRGGMGQVLLARDEELGVDVAVKMLPDLLVKDAEAVSDLKKEVLRGMALTHPGIVRTHTFERDSDCAAIIMEFVDGRSLAELKAERSSGCLPIDEILPWIEQLCQVLDYAHSEARIVHRDLKPRNLMITASGKLKVADFGISALMTETVTRNSGEQMIRGTPGYMSPQHVMGERPSAGDDVYALGATIYELLTGKPPFFRGHILTQIMEVVPPSMTARREELGGGTQEGIPQVWEQTVAACLAKDPADRPQSAGEVFRRLTKGETEPTSPMKTRENVQLSLASSPPLPLVAVDRVPVATELTYVRLPPEEPSSSIFSLSLGKVALIAALAAGGWWIYQKQNPKAAGGGLATAAQPTPIVEHIIMTAVPPASSDTGAVAAAVKREVFSQPQPPPNGFYPPPPPPPPPHHERGGGVLSQTIQQLDQPRPPVGSGMPGRPPGPRGHGPLRGGPPPR